MCPGYILCAFKIESESGLLLGSADLRELALFHSEYSVHGPGCALCIHHRMCYFQLSCSLHRQLTLRPS